jgi:hypothetical protein
MSKQRMMMKKGFRIKPKMPQNRSKEILEGLFPPKLNLGVTGQKKERIFRNGFTSTHTNETIQRLAHTQVTSPTNGSSEAKPFDLFGLKPNARNIPKLQRNDFLRTYNTIQTGTTEGV